MQLRAWAGARLWYPGKRCRTHLGRVGDGKRQPRAAGRPGRPRGLRSPVAWPRSCRESERAPSDAVDCGLHGPPRPARRGQPLFPASPYRGGAGLPARPNAASAIRAAAVTEQPRPEPSPTRCKSLSDSARSGHGPPRLSRYRARTASLRPPARLGDCGCVTPREPLGHHFAIACSVSSAAAPECAISYACRSSYKRLPSSASLTLKSTRTISAIVQHICQARRSMQGKLGLLYGANLLYIKCSLHFCASGCFKSIAVIIDSVKIGTAAWIMG